MSTNMKEANISIFKKLADFATKHGNSIDDRNKRCIETNEIEKEWLKNIDVIEKYPILPSIQTALFKFENQKYFVTVGFQYQEKSDVSNILEYVKINAGILTALLFKLEVPLVKSLNYLDITNEIFYESSDELIKYQFNCVSKFFEPLCIYRINEDCPFTGGEDIDLIRLSGFYILKNRQLISLNFSSNTLDKFEKIFFEGSKVIPHENLLLSLVSSAWKYSFLDIYRCIERLFCISALEEFHNKFQITCSILQFSTDIEDHIGWRPKEEDSLDKIIKKSPQEITNLLQEIKAFIHGEAEGDRVNIIYKIRNSIVHFRGTNKAIYSSLNDLHWDKLINSSLLIVEYWYDKYDLQLRI
jgi:hypothetical protein